MPRMPLTVYYDGNCRLCVAEMSALKSHDIDDVVRLVDCSLPDFQDPEAVSAGISRVALLRQIHARDADGAWLRGVDVFVAVYAIAGFGSIARTWAHPRLRPLWDRMYPWVARHRMLLSRIGLVRVYAAVMRGLMRRNRVGSLTSRCPSGTCAEGRDTPLRTAPPRGKPDETAA